MVTLAGLVGLSAVPLHLNAAILNEEYHVNDPFNSLSRVVLEKNIVGGVNTLTQSMVNKANTIYVIQDDFVLREDVSIPVNCILEFEGGSISGKSITFQEVLIRSNNNYAFRNIRLYGSVRNTELLADWFIDSDKDCTVQLQWLINLLETSNGGTIKFGNHVYNVGYLAVYSKVSLVGQGQGSTIIKSGRIPVNNEAIITVAPTSTLVSIENMSIVGNSSINGIGTSVAVSDVETHSDYYFQENENDKRVQNRLAYKNLHVRNVYVGHCKNGIVISNIGIRVTVDDCDIKYCAENGIVNGGNDNFFSKLYIEHCGLCGFKEQGSNSKLSNIKSIFNGDNDPANSYAFDCSSDLLVNCEAQDNACSGYNLRNRNMLVNCYSNRDAIGNTAVPSYDASQKLVGFRIVGDGNIVNACKVSSYIPSMYWKPYEDLGKNNNVNISISNNTDFYMNPVDEGDSWVTDLGIVETNYQSTPGVNSKSLPTKIYKKEFLPSRFVVVADFVTDGQDLICAEGDASDVLCIDDRLVFKLSYNKTYNRLTALVLNNDFKSEVLSITTESFSHAKAIRLLYTQDGNEGTLSLCYCKDSSDRYTIIKGRKRFSISPIFAAKCAILNGFILAKTEVDHTYIKRFLIGSGVEDNITLANVNTSVKCDNSVFCYDYRNKISLGSSLLNTMGSTANRPSNVYIGFQYFDTTLARPIWWDGKQWIYSDGTVVR